MSFPVIIISSYHGYKRMTVIRVDNASRRQSNIFPKGQLFWEAEAIVGRLHKIIYPAECSGFRTQWLQPPNWRPPPVFLFWRQNVLEAAANREAEAIDGRRQ